MLLVYDLGPKILSERYMIYLRLFSRGHVMHLYRRSLLALIFDDNLFSNPLDHLYDSLFIHQNFVLSTLLMIMMSKNHLQLGYKDDMLKFLVRKMMILIIPQVPLEDMSPFLTHTMHIRTYLGKSNGLCSLMLPLIFIWLLIMLRGRYLSLE